MRLSSIAEKPAEILITDIIEVRIMKKLFKLIIPSIVLAMTLCLGVFAHATENSVEWVACDCGGRVVHAIYYEEYDEDGVRWCTHGGLEYYDAKRMYYYADYCEDCGAVYDMSSNYVVRWYCGYNRKLYTS